MRLLRRTSPGTLVCHWIGSIPFATGLLLAWQSATDSRTTDAGWAAWALALTLLFSWMNCWRSVYAARLRLELSGAADRPWTPARVAGLVASQSFFGATKLAVLPLAALLIFPWAETIAVYRYLPVLGASEDLTPRQMMRQASRLATRHRRQGWAVLPILLLLQAALAINLALLVGALPQAVRILTGYESVYSRSGMYFVTNPVFLLLVAALSWLAFDPFVQAVYTVRYFQAESLDTGEDLRSSLRRLRRAAPVMMALALLILPARADVSPDALRQSVRHAMQSPEYDWRLPPAPAAANTPWIVRVTDRLVAATRNVLHTIGRALDRFFRWLADRLRNAVAKPGAAGPPGAALNWTVALLLAIALAAAGAIAWQRRRARPRRRAEPAASPIRLDAADLTPDLLPEERWLELAERSLAEQNFRFALRAFYLATLAWLGRRELLTIHPGRTNREYSLELRRRTRALPEAYPLFAANVASFERAWYGLHDVSAAEALDFRERGDTLKRLLAGSAGAPA